MNWNIFLKRTIDNQAVDIESISSTYKTQPQKLRRAYKEKLSDFQEFYKTHKDMFDNEAFVFPENIGSNMGIDGYWACRSMRQG